VGGFLGCLVLAPSPSNAVLDARGNQLSGLSDRTGNLDETPFSSVVDGVRRALEAVGVEKDKPPPTVLTGYSGPPIERDFATGRRASSDRLQKCPPNGKECVSSSEEDSGSSSFASPFVYFAQKGDAVGKLRQFLYETPRWTLLGSDGNFFNGLGVYTLCQYEAPEGQMFDFEFSFFPSVLESTVDVRVVRRTTGGAPTTTTARGLAESMGKAMGWLPLRGGGKGSLALDESFAKATLENYKSAVSSSSSSSESPESPESPGLLTARKEGEEDAEIYQQAAVEWRIRGAFEKDVEETDAAIAAQMDDEQRRVAALKADITKLLDQLQKQDDKRESESRALRRKISDTRENYFTGVLQRQGSYRNSGTYGGTISKLSAGTSIGTMINKDEGVTTRLLKLGQNTVD